MVGSEVTASARSRQKNCDGCVQTKRRCDRRTPACTRCLERRAPCVYTKYKARPERQESGTSSTSPSAETRSLGTSPYPFSASGVAFDMDYLENMPTNFVPNFAVESSPQTILDSISGVDTPMGNFLDFLENTTLPVTDQWLVPTEGDHLPERPGTPADEDVVRGYENMATCQQLEPWYLYDPKSTPYNIMKRLKDFPEQMATKNATPFLHRYLYRNYTPQCILSCFTTCVLYSSRTTANTAMVMRALYNSACELVKAEVHRIALTPIEKLARVQALFLYQVIRLFDGDVTFRAQGEKDMPLFKTWLRELCNIRDNLGHLAQLEDAVVREQPPVEWEKWVVAESLRRTVHMAYSVIGLYELIKDPEETAPDVASAWAYTHRWTLSRALWEASSSSEFQRAWREKPHFVISNYAFDGFLENGKGEDVDEFAEITLTVYLGVDAMQEFLTARETANAST